MNTFDFVQTKFTDPQAMIDEAHALGLRFALWHTPYVSNDAEPALELHQEAVDNGYYPPTIGLILTGWGSVIDLSNPAAWDWWQGLLSRYADMGVEGYKLDYAEEIVPGLAATRLAWEFWDGSTERTMQANFQRAVPRGLRRDAARRRRLPAGTCRHMGRPGLQQRRVAR